MEFATPAALPCAAASPFLSCVSLSRVADRLAAAQLSFASDGLWLLEPRMLSSVAGCSLPVRALAPARVGLCKLRTVSMASGVCVA